MTQVEGNLKGLKPSQIKALGLLAQRKVPPEEAISANLARSLTELSHELRRQLGVLIERSGKIRSLFVGDAKGLEISDFGRFRGGATRFRGLRYIHTHLRGEPLSHDDLTDLALLRFDLIAVLQVQENGLPGTIQLAYLRPEVNPPEPWTIEDPTPFHGFRRDFLAQIKALESEFQTFLRQERGRVVTKGQRRTLLVGVTTERLDKLKASMTELEELAKSAHLTIVDRVLQRRHRLDARYVVGIGKMKELYIQCMQQSIDLIVFDGELTGSQVKAISDFGELEVWDRTQLILGLFAERARSRGGKLQVELAMLRYTLPRLVMKDDFLSRLAGGIGAKGPGETKMEVLKRRLRDRIARLERELDSLSQQRRVGRQARTRSGLPVIALVGYTNAGKSTLHRALTGSDVLAEDRLFATLDPTSRRLYLNPELTAILTDTVGFIRDLPEDLVKAFRATLEELGDADLLIHVIDASNPEFADQILTVDELLDDLALDMIPTLRVMNKADRLTEEERNHLKESYPYPFISALDPDSVRTLRQLLEQNLTSHPPTTTPSS